ncbi:hypothetical protein CHUAL_014187 [Chamberlinius hualienensis]
MAPILERCTKLEMRAVIRFLQAEGSKPTEIFNRMSKVYGSKCLSRRRIYEWVDKFRNGVEELQDAVRPGPAERVCTAENISAVDEFIRENSRITVKEISEKLNISVGSAHNIVHKELGFKNAGGKWVLITKKKRLSTASHHLQQQQCQNPIDPTYKQTPQSHHQPPAPY